MRSARGSDAIACLDGPPAENTLPGTRKTDKALVSTFFPVTDPLNHLHTTRAPGLKHDRTVVGCLPKCALGRQPGVSDAAPTRDFTQLSARTRDRVALSHSSTVGKAFRYLRRVTVVSHSTSGLGKRNRRKNV